jgi:LEA14-like dessication related protein
MFQQQRSLTALLAALSLTVLSGCNPGNIRDALENQKPRVSVAGQQLTRLDFQQVGMAFDIRVDNPNPVGLSLGGLDYDLKLAGHSFASGKQNKQMQLKASGPSTFKLPLSMRFAEIYQGLKELKGKSEVPYELTTGLMIDVPLLGKLRYPVTTSGKLPLPRLPKVSVKSLTLDKLNFSGATLALKLKVNNPNAFGVALDKLNYDFKVNGKRWISGNRTSLGNLAANQGNELTLPITLNFMELGSGLYSLLKGGQDLNYNLSGKLDANGGHPLIGRFDVPINRSGKVRLAN